METWGLREHGGGADLLWQGSAPDPGICYGGGGGGGAVGKLNEPIRHSHARILY